MAHAHHHLGADRVFTGETPHTSSEMNVTPLIDVLLVLLVIFMATLPATQRGVDINLPPETKSAGTSVPDASQILLDYTADHRISINHTDVSLAELPSKLRSIYEERKDKTMFIIGAESVKYGEIVTIIDAAKGAGVEKVGIVTKGMQKAAGVSSN